MQQLPEWREVSLAEFEAFLRKYPRPLEALPPLTQRKVNFRAWLDTSLGEWPDNAVAISRARVFLRENCRPTKTIRRRIGSSYGLKQEAERWFGPYISNGAFIAAAYLEGYAIERDGPNAYFSMSLTREYRRASAGGY